MKVFFCIVDIFICEKKLKISLIKKINFLKFNLKSLNLLKLLIKNGNYDLNKTTL